MSTWNLIIRSFISFYWRIHYRRVLFPQISFQFLDLRRNFNASWNLLKKLINHSLSIVYLPSRDYGNDVGIKFCVFETDGGELLGSSFDKIENC